jgi:hypothetical protein
MFMGLVSLILGLQLLGFTLRGYVVAIPFVWVLLGIGTIAIGFFAQRGRDWATIAGTALSCFLFLLDAIWIVLGLSSGFFSLMGLFLLPVSLAAAIVLAFAIRPAAKVSAARKKLEQDGLGLGI